MKTIVITGANGGLGTAVTQLFLERGYRVIATVSDRSKQSFLTHERLAVVQVDLANEEIVAKFVAEAIKDHGPVSGALLLAGGFAAGGIAATPASLLSNQLSINFDTAYFVARPLLEHMTQQKHGRIIFIGSRAALEQSYAKDLVAYSLSKSLLLRLAEYINESSKGTDVTATVIAPSTIDTPANRKAMPDADFSKWVSPVQLAEIMEFVVSDKSSPLRETVLKVYNNA